MNEVHSLKLPSKVLHDKFEHVDEEELIEMGLDAGRSTSGKYRTYAASISSNASKNSIRICSSASKSDSG
jgi:hypothetical protein